MRTRHLLVAAATTATLATVGLAAGPAQASGSAVRATGACSGQADWKLKASNENANRIQTEVEIEDARPGSSWRLTLKVDGVVKATATRTADALGDLRLARLVQGDAGRDTVSFVAVQGANRQTCTGSVTL